MFRATPIFRSFKCTLQTVGLCTLWKTEVNIIVWSYVRWWLQLNNVHFCLPQSTHTYGLQSTFEAPEDGRSPKHEEPTNK